MLLSACKWRYIPRWSYKRKRNTKKLDKNMEVPLIGGGAFIFIKSRQLCMVSGFPTPKYCSPCNTVNSKGEGSHAKITVVSLAHLLHIFETFGHVRLQLIVHFLLIPHESLDVLQSINPPKNYHHHINQPNIFEASFMFGMKMQKIKIK